MKTASDRTLRDSENSVAHIRSEDRVLLPSVTYEVAVRYPLRLHEFELTLQMSTDQQENAASIYAVILQDAFRQRCAVIRAPPKKMMKIYGYKVVLQSVARIHTSNVRTERAHQPLRVIRVTENVVAIGVCAQLGIVTFRGEHQRCTTAPSAHHLRCDQFLFFRR